MPNFKGELKVTRNELIKVINRFTGIKHYFGRSDFDGCDCIGLVRLFYLEHGTNLTFDDGQPPVTQENYFTTASWRRLFRYIHKHFDELTDDSELSYGDMVLFRINDCEHMGVIVDKYGKCLSMEIPEQEGITQSTLYHKSIWHLVEHKIYRPKGGVLLDGNA